MADAYHYFGNDLQWGSDGDIQTSSAIQESQQRVLRRLMTNPQSYYWHPEYGAGIGRYIGRPTQESEIETRITTNMFLEDSVVQNPPPQVDFENFQNGIQTDIRYVESDNNQPVTLSFSATQ